MNKKLIHALEDCLQALQNGTSLESALARYPDLSNELRPFLHTAQAAQNVDPDPISQKAFLNGRTHLLAQVNDLRRKQGSRMRSSPVLRFALSAGFVLVLMVASGSGLLTASANSLPDDPLYGVKRTAESIQLGLTFNPAQKDALEDEFHQRRIEETESLLASQRAVEVKFSGLVESQLTDGWLVSGIRVMVTPQTEVDAGIAPGMHVEVEGSTQANGTVLAKNIRLETDTNGSSNSSGSGEGQATETAHPESEETSQSEGGSSNSGSGGSESGSPSEGNTSGSNGSGDQTKTPEPTRTPEPTKTEAATKTPESTRTPEPTRTPKPTN